MTRSVPIARQDGLQQDADYHCNIPVGARPDGRCLYRYQSDCHAPNEQELFERHATVSIQGLAADVYGTAVHRNLNYKTCNLIVPAGLTINVVCPC